MSSGFAYVTMRKLGPYKLHMSYNPLYFGLVACPLSVVGMVIMSKPQEEPLKLSDCYLLLGLGFSGWLG